MTLAIAPQLDPCVAICGWRILLARATRGRGRLAPHNGTPQRWRVRHPDIRRSGYRRLEASTGPASGPAAGRKMPFLGRSPSMRPGTGEVAAGDPTTSPEITRAAPLRHLPPSWKATEGRAAPTSTGGSRGTAFAGWAPGSRHVINPTWVIGQHDRAIQARRLLRRLGTLKGWLKVVARPEAPATSSFSRLIADGSSAFLCGRGLKERRAVRSRKAIVGAAHLRIP